MTKCHTCGLEKGDEEPTIYDHRDSDYSGQWLMDRSEYSFESMCPSCVKVLIRHTNNTLVSWRVIDDDDQNIGILTDKDSRLRVELVKINKILKYRDLAEEFEQFMDGDWKP